MILLDIPLIHVSRKAYLHQLEVSDADLSVTWRMYQIQFTSNIFLPHPQSFISFFSTGCPLLPINPIGVGIVGDRMWNLSLSLDEKSFLRKDCKPRTSGIFWAYFCRTTSINIFWVVDPKVSGHPIYMVSPATWLKQEIRLRDKSCTTLPNDLDIIFKIDQTDRTCSLWMGTLIFCSKLPVGTKHWENWWFSFTYFTDIAVIHHSISSVDGKTCQTAFLLTMSCSNVVVFSLKRRIPCYISLTRQGLRV